jgi:hypothetical protein
LSAKALWWCDQVAGGCVGRGRAVVTADQMEAQVDAGCDTGGREKVAVIDEEAGRQHLNFGEAALQLVGLSPMRRRACAVRSASSAAVVTTASTSSTAPRGSLAAELLREDREAGGTV